MPRASRPRRSSSARLEEEHHHHGRDPEREQQHRQDRRQRPAADRARTEQERVHGAGSGAGRAMNALDSGRLIGGNEFTARAPVPAPPARAAASKRPRSRAVVGRHHQGRAVPVGLVLDERRHPLAALVVEAGGRLVGQQDGRPVDHPRGASATRCAWPWERVEGWARANSANPEPLPAPPGTARRPPAARRGGGRGGRLSSTLRVSRRWKLCSSSPMPRPRNRSRAAGDRSARS